MSKFVIILRFLQYYLCEFTKINMEAMGWRKEPKKAKLKKMKHQHLFATRQLTFQQLLKQQVFGISNIAASKKKRWNKY